jgi:nicotinate-nucleotide adenylyltransferase
MKIGLYFGSFNPIHSGHLLVANYVLNETALEKIWLIVSPQNPHKDKNSLLNEYQRFHLARLAVQDDSRIKASDVEFKLSKPSFTANTLAHLKEKHPSDDFSIIMGSDSYQNISKWKNFEYILENYSIYVYSRPGFEISNNTRPNINLLSAPLIQISSSQIRKYIEQSKSIRYLVPESVREEIETRRFYKPKYQNT